MQETEISPKVTNVMTSQSKISQEFLDIGCGPNRIDNAIGLDIEAYPNVDVVHDVNQCPWPLPDNQFSYIKCQHAIEHFHNLHGVAKEMYRTAKNGCKIEFKTPHYSSFTSYGDPTHIHHFSQVTIPMLFDQAVGNDKYEVKLNKILFSSSAFAWMGRLLYWMSPRRYEKFFAWTFPAHEIHCIVEIKK